MSQLTNYPPTGHQRAVENAPPPHRHAYPAARRRRRPGRQRRLRFRRGGASARTGLTNTHYR
eukprot:1951901-Prymnesium_polylepis.1